VSEPDLVRIGPFRGINNTADEVSPVYAGSDEALPFLREAENVDLSRDGWLYRRSGIIKLLDLADGHSLIAVGGLLLVADGGTLLRVFPGDTLASTRTETLVSGLDPRPIRYALIGDTVFWCNGAQRGRILADGTATHWGLEPPAIPTLTPTPGGALPAGMYLVALTCEDATGLESGARLPAVIELTAPGGIAVSWAGIDPAATAVNLYLTDTNGRDLFWADSADATDGTRTLATLAQSTTPLHGLIGLDPPPLADSVLGYRGRAMVGAGPVLAWSQPLAYHHFKRSTDVQLFAEPINLLGALHDGFYVAEGPRTWWITGDDPDAWMPQQVDDRPVARGPALEIPGRHLPSLQTTAPVLVWISDTGPVAGLSGGIIVHLTDDAVAMDSHATASLALREERGMTQILMQLRDQNATTRFGFSDRMDATVIKAQPAAPAP
jgi:hypothetical protein